MFTFWSIDISCLILHVNLLYKELLCVCAGIYGYLPLKDVVFMCNHCHVFYPHEIMTERHVNKIHSNQPLPDSGLHVSVVTLENVVGVHDYKVSPIEPITNYQEKLPFPSVFLLDIHMIVLLIIFVYNFS